MSAWSHQELVERLRHPDAAVRRWAAERLRARFPERAPEALVGCLDDPDRGLAILSAGVLQRAADPRWGPALLERFERAEGLLAGQLAAALGAARYRPALPALLARLGRPELAVESLRGVCEALGAMGQAAALRAALERGAAGTEAAGALSGALFEAGSEEDYTWLAEVLWSRFTPPQRAAAGEHIAARLAATELLHELRWALQQGITEAVDVAEAWIGSQVDWPAGRLHSLVPGWWSGPGRWLGDLAAEAARLGGAALPRRGAALLAALAAAAPDEAPEEGLTDLSLTLTCALAVSRDDAAALAASGEDRARAVLELLGSRREQLWAEAEAAAAAMGPAVLPALLDILEGGDSYWGAVRAARAIGRLARSEPAAAEAAVAPLFDAIRRDGSGALAEAAMWALIAIGRPALGPIRRSLLAGTDGERVMLEILGEIPDPEAAAILVHYARSVGFMDELVVAALVDSGSPLAVEVLAEAWSPGERELAEALLLICAINDLAPPQLEQWRQDLSGARRHQLRWSRELGARRRERRRVAEDRGGESPGEGAAESPPPDVDAIRRQRKARQLARKRRRRKRGRR